MDLTQGSPAQSASLLARPPRTGASWPAHARSADRRTLWPARRHLAGLWRDHRLLTVAIALSLAPRVLAALAFRPALFTPDSFGYLAQGARLGLGVTRPSGYPILLRALAPLHSLLLVTSVQHLLGIATAAIGYSVMRRWGLPAWGAVLAVCPTLFDSRQVALESSLLPDTWYAFLLMVSVALLLTRRRLTASRCALAGLVIAWAAITRGNGAAEMAGVLAVLAIRRTGWRALTCVATAFAVPVLSYMAVFDAHHGSFALTQSEGMFLWSRTMSFADCAVIDPPPDLRPLCPDQQAHHPAGPTPAWSVPAMLSARSPAGYLWAGDAWWRHDARPGFNAANNARAMRFAVAAIRAQPAAYLRTVASGVMRTFVATDRAQTVRTLHFTPAPDVPALNATQISHLRAYAHTASDTRQVQPYAYLVYLYQQPVYFPGIVFMLVMLAGLAGVIRQRRQRGGPAALAWAVAAIGVVAPVALHEAHYRYVISIVPIATLAAGLAFVRQRPARRAPAGTHGGQRPPVTAGTARPVPAPWQDVVL